MKKAIILLTIIVATLTSCEKSCYQFNITTNTVSKYNESTDITYVKKCDLTARQARKVADSMESTATTGVGSQKITVTTTCTYYIK
jgi:hypothetical protein